MDFAAVAEREAERAVKEQIEQAAWLLKRSQEQEAQPSKWYKNPKSHD